jgi:hypothetical protein
MAVSARFRGGPADGAAPRVRRAFVKEKKGGEFTGRRDGCVAPGGPSDVGVIGPGQGVSAQARYISFLFSNSSSLFYFLFSFLKFKLHFEIQIKCTNQKTQHDANIYFIFMFMSVLLSLFQNKIKNGSLIIYFREYDF